MKKIKMKLVRCGYTLICLSLSLMMVPITVFAEPSEKKVVHIGIFEDTYNKVGENGEISGYGYEYLQKIASYAGWKCEYVEADWSNCFEKLQNGEIDIIDGISYTEERAQDMLFSSAPMGKEQYYIYADAADTDISAADLGSFVGKNIGVLKGHAPEAVLNEWESQNNVKMQHINISTTEEVQKNLADHKIDCFVSVEERCWGNVLPIVNIGSSDIYFAINKERTDLKVEMDCAMRRIAYDNPFYTDDLYKKFLSTQSASVLSEEEQMWLKEHGSIRIGYLTNDSGISATDPESGELVGVINDYINYAKNCISNQTLDFEIMAFDSMEKEIEALRSDEIDMIFKVPQNPYYAEQNELSLSETVMIIPFMGVTSQERFEENEENSVAIVKDDLAQKWYINYNYPNWKIIECDSIKQAEKLVKNGKADCLISRSVQIRKYLKDDKLKGIPLADQAEISFAVNRENKTMLSIVNKTLKTMPDDMLTNALSMYENTVEKVTAADFISDNLSEVVLVLTIVISFLFMILILLRRSKIAEAKAKDAMRMAEGANTAKSNFLFNMSHDIRTPMNAILGFAELAERKLDEPEFVTDYLHKIQMSGKGMLLILDKVLEISRIESGKTTLEESPHEVEKVLDSCVTMMHPEIEKKHLVVTVEKEVQNPYVYFDEARITEIILNILSNAVKYTADNGKIHCVLSQSAHLKEGWIYQELLITDNGIGMSEEFQKHIFDLFERERSSTVSGIPGTGLGMGITRKLVELMNGTITVESKAGEGTAVSVKIPMRIASLEDTLPKQSTMLTEKEKLNGKRILLAEDNDLNAEIAITLLEEEGLQVDRAVDGVQCIEKLEHCVANYYSLILMDIQMPNLDGYQTTEKIRKFEDPQKAEIPIIAMTANAFTEDRIKAIHAGMNEHVAKPIDMDILIATMLKYI